MATGMNVNNLESGTIESFTVLAHVSGQKEEDAASGEGPTQDIAARQQGQLMGHCATAVSAY